MKTTAAYSSTGSTARRILLAGTLVASALALLIASPVRAQSGAIVLDGQFADWLGQPNVPDVQGDAQNTHTDLSAFYFTSNPDQDYLYFMAERWNPGSQGLDLTLSIDTNNNGVYSEAADRVISVIYHPNLGGRTYVNLYDGQGGLLKVITDKAYWGEPGPGSRVEWGVTFSDLGIAPFQTIRIQLNSNHGTNVSDVVAEAQWSPADALGYWLLALVMAGGLGWIVYKRRVMV